MQNPESGIQVFVQIIQTESVVEGKEFREDFVSPDMRNVLIKNSTKSLDVAVRILNDKRHEYSLWEVYDVAYPNETYPYHTEHLIYSGKLSFKQLMVRCPIKGVESGRLRLEVRDRKGKPMMVVGPVVYSRGKEAKTPN